MLAETHTCQGVSKVTRSLFCHFWALVAHNLLCLGAEGLWDVAEGDGVVWPGDKEAEGGPNHTLQLPERNYSKMVACLFPHPVYK